MTLILTANAFGAQNRIQEAIRNRIESSGIPLKMSIAGEVIHAGVMLPKFYESRTYRPAWITEGRPISQSGALLQVVRESQTEGLRPSDYHLNAIESILSTLKGASSAHPSDKTLGLLTDLDLLLSDAYLVLAAHLLAGRLDPHSLDPLWKAHRREADLSAHLSSALSSETVPESLHALRPAHDGYRLLMNLLADYRRIEASGGWPEISGGPKLQKGDRHQRILRLRQRLKAEGLLSPSQTGNQSDLFDDDLVAGVMRFQLQAGLEDDGIVGTATLKSLNLSVTDRIDQIIVNLERWRWLPQSLGERYLIVNIAEFQLTVFENGTPRLQMRVVVGKPYRRTPVFSDSITYIVMNPYWNIPHKIAVQDILPKVKSDPNFLVDQKIRVYRGWQPDAREVNPLEVDWQAIVPNNFPFHLKQDPGPQNALGRVKFMFPNPYDVYLHDTPSRALFSKARRDFSSGCIRIEKPSVLAEYLLQNHPDWSTDKIRKAIEGPEIVEKTVKLPQPIGVHLLYWTVSVDAAGNVHLGTDVYERDKLVSEALQKPAPTP